MSKSYFLLTLFTLSFILPTSSQDQRPAFMPKGQMYFYWGYNRECYSRSDISFNSSTARFTLYDVEAKDRPSPFSFHDYVLNPSIPQFNMRLGYAISDNFSVSIGTDHMKYVMVANQLVKITGEIANTDETGKYGGRYDDEDIVLSPDFLRYEHTNGLNYISVDADYFGRIWRNKSGFLDLGFSGGLSAGVLYPRSDVDVFDVEGVNVFHVAGWGSVATAGVHLRLGKYFFMSWNNRAGFMGMPNVLCRLNDFTAKQNFWVLQTAFLAGISAPLINKK